MECTLCSTSIPDDSKFCLNCGADVSDPSGATTASLTDARVAHMVNMLREETKGEFEVDREIGRGEHERALGRSGEGRAGARRAGTKVRY